jgi:signal transduction histidine kinase
MKRSKQSTARKNVRFSGKSAALNVILQTMASAPGDTADFQALFEKSPALCLVLDPNFIIVGASDSYVGITEIPRENMVGKPLFEVLSENADSTGAFGVPGLRRSLERVVRERVADVMTVQKHDIRSSAGGLEERYWKPVNTPVFGGAGEIKYIIHTLEEVTELVHLKASHEESGRAARRQRQRVATMENEVLSHSEQLRAANEQLTAANAELAARTAELNDLLHTMQTFTYSIAHDLRGPLRALNGFSALVMEECGNKLDDNGKSYLHHINEAAQRMDKLLLDLLTYGRLTHVEVTVVPLALEGSVGKVLEELRGRIQDRNAVVEVQGALPTVLGNAALLNHVLINLLDNALKFVAPERTPRIVIQARRREGHVRLSITDNGIGIAPAYQEKIFELFVRLHKPAAYPGTGIGLAVVKKAMERMRGKVGLESIPGEGSRFWLEFPAAR